MLLVRLGAGIGHAVFLPDLAGMGLFIGFIAGMFGVGGGFLLTPLLIYVFGVPPAIAVGSALSQKCGTSISSFLRYRKFKLGEPKIDLLMLGGSVMGVDAGTRLLAYLTDLGQVYYHGREMPVAQLVLDILFIVLLSFTAFFMFRDAWQASKRVVPRGDLTIPGPLVTRVRIPPYVDFPSIQLERVSVPMLAYLGFVLGVASGLMGIGGGVLFMPILLYGMGLSMRNAAGTGIIVLLVTVAVGTFEQSLRNFVSLKLAMAILIGSSIGAQLGVLTTHFLPNRVLRLLFAVLVLATVLIIGRDLLSFAG